MNQTQIRRPLVIVLIISALCLLIIVFAVIFGFRLREQLREHRPLVMIHSPNNQQEFNLGDTIILHSTAREQGGVASIRLWIDGRLVAEEIAIDEANPTMLVLHSTWTPDTLGRHSLIVRSVSTGRVEGQASLQFEVNEVVAGEELAIASSDAGPAEGEDSPGGTGSGGEDRPGGSASSAPEGASTSPAEHAPAPGSMEEVAYRFGFPRWAEMRALPDEPLVLELELLALTTDRAYGGLHCYLGAGPILPRWYPDLDGDQFTDESFPSLGGGEWDVASSLSGTSAYTFEWASMDPIPLDMTCVGLAAGGMEAVEIGRVEAAIESREWDGITRLVWSTPIEGQFSVEYRVSVESGSVPGHTIELDRDMNSPFNLRMGFYTLHWEYDLDPLEEPIHGFRIFLNGTLQWTEPPDARQSYLPYEWLSPHCGEAYNFHVDAYRGEDWSYPSNMVTVEGPTIGSEECDRTILITFDTLETRDLGRDDGDGIGTAYGSFYVGDREIRFDGRCRESGYCEYFGLDQFETYSIPFITTNWGPGSPRFVVDVPPEEDVVVGFSVTDEGDTCSASRVIESDSIAGAYSTSVGTEDVDWVCRVTISIQPLLGAPVGEVGDDPPLPYLNVTDLSVDEATGQLEIHVRNSGRATWPAKDLDVIAQWPSGTLIGHFVFPELVLRPGDTTVLKHPALVPRPHPPLGACITLDPGNQVPEEDDYAVGIWSRERYCRGLPDLTITDVVLDQAESRLLVTVQNIGSGTIEDRTLHLELRLDEVTTIVPSDGWPGVSMEPWDRRVLLWEDLAESARERLREGYTVIIDPYNEIAETDGTNNTFTIAAGGMYEISWWGLNVPYYEYVRGYGWHVNEDTFLTGVFAENGWPRLLAEWDQPTDEDFCVVNPDQYGTYRQCNSGRTLSVEVELEGDETVFFYVSGRLHVGPLESGLGFCIDDCDHSMGTTTIRAYPSQWSEAGPCGSDDELRLESHLFPPGLPGENSWISYYSICRVE